MGKYAPLTRFLRQQQPSRITLRFAELEEILGFSLPESAFKYPSWWNNSALKQSQVKGWRDAGWEVREADLRGRKVTFVRVSGEPVAAAGSGQKQPAGVAAGAGGGFASRAGAGAVRESVADRGARPAAGRLAGGRSASASGQGSALAAAVDMARLPAAVRRVLEVRAARHGRAVGEEVEALLRAVMAEERAALLTELAKVRTRTQRPGAFDMLEVLGRK